MDNNERERYSRQILLPEIGEEGQQRLSSAKVLIVGAGGLGSPIALYLAGAGVGTIGLIDDDVVSISNLQRQVLYEESQVGQPKVLCAQKRLNALNAEVKVNIYNTRLTKENAEKLICQYDIIVDGCDNFEARYVISDTCKVLGKTYIYGAICGLEGQVAVLCHKDADGRVVTFRDLFPEENIEHSGKEVVGVTPAVVGSVEASQTLQLICGYGEPIINKLWTIDLRTMQSFTITL